MKKKILTMALASVSALAIGLAVTGDVQAKSNKAKKLRKNMKEAQSLSYSSISTAQTTNVDERNIEAFKGDITPFWGNITPFWGQITPFWGQITPFWGQITPFWDETEMFWGNITPFNDDITPFWGQITPFWDDAGSMISEIENIWQAAEKAKIEGNDDAAEDLVDDLKKQLKNLNNFAKKTWQEQIRELSGQNYNTAFAKKLIDKYGIDFDDSQSFLDLDKATRAAFFLDFYDGLMVYSGADLIDHWMPLIRWRPRITQEQGGGVDAVVGLLDSNDGDGFTHGAAVKSIIAAPHDGTNVMGIAPGSQFLYHNPFDETGTANWREVADGVKDLADRGAHIINMSLGDPEYTLHANWSKMLSNADTKDAVLVKAAGNSGLAQTTDISWQNFDLLDNLVIVGSVNPSGEISTFSNRPGEACILDKDVCHEDNKLKYRYLVAPGELILVNDNKGGTKRLSGTSFAAPFVTGAAALIHDRWPWFKKHARETTDLLFESATDLGEEGVDAIYGHGLLNVEASQSPLDMNDLRTFVFNGVSLVETPIDQIGAALVSANRLLYAQENELYVVAYEDIGDTFRDFYIPLSSNLVGESVHTGAGSQQFQSFLFHRMLDWAYDAYGITDAPQFSAPLAVGENWSLAMAATNLGTNQYAKDGQLPFHGSAMLSNRETGTTLRFGSGSNAYALNHGSGFGLMSDYDPLQGGVNPILGFASGGKFVSAEHRLTKKISINLGITHNVNDHTVTHLASGEELRKYESITDYQATAIQARLNYHPSETFKFGVNVVRLVEDSGLLGNQGSTHLNFDDGATTDSLAIDSQIHWSSDTRFSISTTIAKTQPTDFTNSLFSFDHGLTSTAFAAAISKSGAFRKNDELRIAVSQPLRIENGFLTLSNYEVTDRQTGKRAVVDQRLNLSPTGRQTDVEILYSTNMLKGSGKFSGFLKVSEGHFHQAGETEIAGGLKLGIKF